MRQLMSFIGLHVQHEADNFADLLSAATNNWNGTPNALFQSLMAILIVITLLMKILGYLTASRKEHVASKVFLREEKPNSIEYLERIYLPVFWLLRLAFWMSGPFFYTVYASKSFDGEFASGDIIRQIFLAGFVTAAILLPLAGRSADRFGKMKGTLIAAAAYGLGALSTQSSSLVLLMVGRGMGVLGTGLMTSIPEAWLASAAKETKEDPNGRWLCNIFATAYSFDYMVAICAGQLATRVAELRGPKGPFELSPVFILLAVLIVLCFWKENHNSAPSAAKGPDVDKKSEEPSFRDGIKMIRSDSKILMVGCIQSLFDAATYIFVMQWAPAMSAAATEVFGEVTSFPFGTVFSCFMACCLIGSSLHVELTGWAFRTERTATVMLAIATLSLASVGYLFLSRSQGAGLYEMVAAFFVFEACVGMYFPSISWLRSKYIPVHNRATITALFGKVFIVLNVCIILSISKVGVAGAWCIAASAVGLACLCLINLQIVARREASKNGKLIWKRAKAKMRALGRMLRIRRTSRIRRMSQIKITAKNL